MAFSLGGSKNKGKSSQTVDQTQTNTLSDRAAGLLMGGIGRLEGRQFQGLNPEDIARFQNPYQTDVVDATMAQLAQDRLEARNGLKADMAGAGAFGDKRRGVLEAQLEGGLDRNTAATLAGLNAQGFNTALSAAQGENMARNQYDLSLEELIARLRSGFANEGTSRTQGTTTGRTSNIGLSGSFTPFGGG